MAKYLENVVGEPAELRKSLAYTLGAGRGALEEAAGRLRKARDIFITGIGSSWHAGMAVQAAFAARGFAAHLVDASELLHFTPLPDRAALIALSRSGKSVEIVKLLEKAAAANATVIGVTNTPESPLGQRAAVVLKMEAAFDHLVSVTMYSALTLVGGLLAEETCGRVKSELQKGLNAGLVAAEARLPEWRRKMERSNWFEGAMPTYFLARGGSLASCYETRLLWEEAAKSGACAMTTGGFRHGPQEMVINGARVGLWLDQRVLRNEDLALVEDLRKHGVKTMVIGQNVKESAADLVLEVPAMEAGCEGWQFLLDIIPGQLAAYRMAQVRGADCDSFAICPYVITTEGGLAAGTQ